MAEVDMVNVSALPRKAGSSGIRRSLTSVTSTRSALLVFLLVLWQINGQLDWVDTSYVSTPASTVRAIGAVLTDTSVLEAFGQTFLEVLVAFMVSMGIGLVMGISMGEVALLRKAYYTPLVVLMSVPKVMFIPILVIAFGLGSETRTVFGIIEASPYVAINVVAGVDLIEQQHRRLAEAYNAPRWELLTAIIVPAAMPGLGTALWYGLRYSFSGVLVAGLFASTSGIGQLIQDYTINLKTSNLVAVIALASIVVLVVSLALRKLVERMSRWRKNAGMTQNAGMTMGAWR